MPEEGCGLLLSRRSIRRYKPDPVGMELILKALDIARFAPSAHNKQPWEFIVVRDRAMLEKLSKVHRWSGPIAGAQAAIIVLADKNQAPDSYLQDGSIAATYLWLSLHCVGLGTVWIYTLQEARAIQEIVGTPEHMFPVAIFPVGFPAEQPKARPRKELKEIVHLDSYGKRLE